MGTLMIRLVQMNEEEFEPFAHAIAINYADGKVKSGSWDADNSIGRAKMVLEKILPQGMKTRNHFFYTIQDGGNGEHVGSIWLGVREKTEDPPGLWVWDIMIDEKFRRKGYGRQAMLAAENLGREMGQNSISLHVFGHNRAAVELYRSLGYEPASIVMTKQL